MKKLAILLYTLLCPFLMMAQFESGENVVISQEQQDDIYLSGESVTLNAPVTGDVVAAAGNIQINDSISSDLTAAGGEIVVNGMVGDDLRVAGGTLTIDTEIGDDLMIFGGEVEITRNSIIHGNLICFAGDVRMDGNVQGMVKMYGGNIKMNGTVAKDAVIYGGELDLNGEIRGKSKLAAEVLNIGTNAKFYNDVAYWTETGEVDFKSSLINSKATYSEDLGADRQGFSWKYFGVTALVLWVLYMLSAFLVILFLNMLFKAFFSRVAILFNRDVLKSIGIGALYLLGMPLIIFLLMVSVIGIPIGLFLLFLYVFSLFFGHLVVALLITHFMDHRKGGGWSFWAIVFIALGVAAVLQIIFLIPIIGWLASIVAIALAYGFILINISRK
ncbi:hypothetical protein L1I30_05590 [Gillisia sp. M10.2A]|uniref:Polymer-forming cytoskeletal protein n=1 Tax=Gillisia lutea TaxID=2909668 RepID=A0ABS9EH24_9FLAO|nr:hypothetical protein [Gillisia lutea]MCF4101129.1 hypothetical protein [Gillisia lutea]